MKAPSKGFDVLQNAPPSRIDFSATSVATQNNKAIFFFRSESFSFGRILARENSKLHHFVFSRLIRDSPRPSIGISHIEQTPHQNKKQLLVFNVIDVVSKPYSSFHLNKIEALETTTKLHYAESYSWSNDDH